MLLADKQAQYNEFFTLPLELNINLTPFDDTENTPDEAHFLLEMPYSFKLATQVSSLDASALRTVRNIGSQADELVNFLNLQSQKIDLIMSYLLMQEDIIDERQQTIEFGAGGLSVILAQDYPIEQRFRLKIFMPEESSAVYCYAEIIERKALTKGFEYKLIYTRIRAEDREILVRTALHEQSKQLRKLAEKKSESVAESKPALASSTKTE